jgi:hypothetical protein
MPSDTYTLIISDSGFPSSHKTTHEFDGTDALSLDAAQITTGTLAVANGGTGTTTSTGTGSIVRATSPTLSSPTFTAPVLGTPTSGTLTSCTGLPLTTGTTGQLPVSKGGTNLTTVAPGNVLYASATDVISPLAIGASGRVFVSNGTVPSWGQVDLTSGVTNTLPVLNGGTGTTTSTGTGSIVRATAPTLSAPVLGTPTSGVLTSCTGLPLTTGTTGQLPVSKGGTGVSSVNTGDLLYATAANTLSALSSGSNSGYVLTTNGAGVLSWSAPSVVTTVAANKGGTGMTSYSIGDIIYADSTSTLDNLPAAGVAGKVLTSNLSGIPSWEYPTINNTLAVSSGGTGQTSISTGQLLCGGTSANTFDKISPTTSGFILTSNGPGTKPTWQAPTSAITGTVSTLTFDTSPTSETLVPGELRWNTVDNTLDLALNADVTLQIGQESNLYCHAAEAISNGQVVYIDGAAGGAPSIRVATNANTTALKVLGVATQDIDLGFHGYITTTGLVRGLDTTGQASGATLWLGTAGDLITTEPSFPAAKVKMATVISGDDSEGTVFVQAQFFSDGRVSGQFTWGANSTTGPTITVTGLTSSSNVVIQERYNGSISSVNYAVASNTNSFTPYCSNGSGMSTRTYSYIAFLT